MSGPISLLFSALAAGSLALSHAPAPSQQYVYTYVSNSEGRNVIGRFPIVNGIVSSTPASTVVVTFSSNIAVGPDGSLYVSGLEDTGHPHWATVVDVYAPGAHGLAKPVRQLYRKVSSSFAIAVDQQGYLYWQSWEGKNPLHVYAPGANGEAKPVVSINDGGVSLAIDAAGNLDVSSGGAASYYAKADVWSNPHTKPVLTQRYCFPGMVSGAFVGDGAGNAYLVALPVHGNQTPGIIRYAAGAPDCPTKVHRFLTSPNMSSVTAMAEFDENLFIYTYSPPWQLLEVPTTGANPRLPIATLSNVTGPYLAIGP